LFFWGSRTRTTQRGENNKTTVGGEKSEQHKSPGKKERKDERCMKERQKRPVVYCRFERSSTVKRKKDNYETS